MREEVVERAATGSSATGVVFACIVCERRFPQSARCPHCGLAHVVDMRVADQRERVVRVLERPALGSVFNVGWRWPLMGAAAAVALPTAFVMLVAGQGLAWVVRWSIFAASVGVLALLYRILARGRGPAEVELRTAGTKPLRVHAVVALPAGPTHTIRGTVKTREAIV